MNYLKTQNEYMHFRINSDEKKELKKAAKKMKTRVSNLLRLAVSYILASMELKEKNKEI